MSYPNSPEIYRGVGEGSEVTEVSSVPQDNDAPNSENKISENEPEIAKLGTGSPEDAIRDDGLATTDSDSKERKKGALSVDSDSDSDSDDSEGYYFRSLRRAIKHQSSLSIFNAYKHKMELKAAKNNKRNQGANLVKGLVDYLRVLEDRIDQLESGTVAKVKVDEPGEASSEAPSEAPIENDNSTIELVVKFFDSAAYLQDDGSYPALNDETEKGSFVCGHDAQHLIRVLYSKVKSDGAEALRQADPEAPKVDDIEILTFGVLSEAISAFFAKQLDIPAGDDHLIRFGKPFRPLIRNLGSVREQLERLKGRYGQVMTEDIERSGTAWDSSTETPATTENREESDSLPFAPTKSSGDNGIPAYELPAALPHFEAFLAFVDKFFGKQIQLYERLRKGEEQHIAFENLWMLFDADDTIYCPLREAMTEEYTNVEGPDHTPIQRYTPQAYRVVATSGGMPLMRTMAPKYKMKDMDVDFASVSLSKSFMKSDAKTLANILTQTAKISRKIRNNYTEFNVYCFYIDFNGVEFGTVREVFVFKPYEREIDIRNLQAYPAQYELREKLYDNGERFIDATSGPDTDKAFIKVPEFRSPASLWLNDVEGEIYDLYEKSECSHKWCYRCSSNAYIKSQKTQRNEIESKIKLVFEEYESEKQQRGKNGLKYLKKLMENNDMIRLLPGAVPGFALRNRKWVLLNLTKLKPVKQNDNWENLVLPSGHRQMVQAMVETHTQDFGSNGGNRIGMDLVQGKVFLRMLEYYSGILFLTTNRVGAIDDAFRSRLHLTLYYPKLTGKQTRKIFEHNFQRIADINKDRNENELPNFDYQKSEKKIMQWAKQERKTLGWNGRQIRNAFQTVLALSEFRANKSESKNLTVTKKDFQIVASASMQFNHYLRQTHGVDEDIIAGREYMRAQSYKPSSGIVKSFDQDDSDSSSEEEDSSNGSGDDTDPDDRDERKKKKGSKGKKEKGVKSSSKKSKKTSENKTKEEKRDKKKEKEKKKGKKEKEESDDSDDSDDSD
ncbi:hypothetical protein NHQ30_010580 [Ciborinia camelliae]|nr:hypothetical protein NHQ30_010580 [Ciborinia camelliae]